MKIKSSEDTNAQEILELTDSKSRISILTRTSILAAVIFLTYFIFENLLLLVLIALLALCFIFKDVIRVVLIQPKLMRLLKKGAKKELENSWMIDGKIEPSCREGMVTGISRVGNVSFPCGVKYDSKGVHVQIVSAATQNILFFDWDSFLNVELAYIVKYGKTQKSAIFQLINYDLTFLLPWDSRFNYVFDRGEID
jgi:hypothetical protein